ncbi:uncharacterized protein LOC142597623 isoform X2 [Dermatophagoides farinae]|uniref:uncharacterized protein LOC142597623 isoform X2 n=1 Tax=Dermatophagoides farinae TaxID=6954 RepID=UPI003F61B582
MFRFSLFLLLLLVMTIFGSNSFRIHMVNNGKHWNPIMVDNNHHHHQLKKNDLTINHNSQLNLIQSFLPIHSHNDHYHGIRQQYQSYTIIPKLNPIPITISLSNEPFIPLQSELMADSYNDGLKNNKKQQQNFSCQLYNTQTRLYGILRPQWWWWQCLFNDYQQPQQRQQQQTNNFGQQSTEDFVHDTNHWNAYFVNHTLAKFQKNVQYNMEKSMKPKSMIMMMTTKYSHGNNNGGGGGGGHTSRPKHHYHSHHHHHHHHQYQQHYLYSVKQSSSLS